VSAGVLILLENEPYPHDRRVSQEALALVEAGYDVTVVSPNAAVAPELETSVDGVRVLRFPALPAGEGAVGYVREYLLAAVRMRRVLRRLHGERFRAVIACNPPDFLIQLARPFARHGAGLVFDLHDPSPELFEAMFQRRGLVHRVLVAFERWAERTADVVMTVNEPCAELVRERGGIAAERVSVLVTCPNPRWFFPVEPRPELRRGKEHLVLWIGRMSRKENLPMLVDAADELVNRHGRSDIAFAIVGYGDVREELEALVEHRGLTGSVFLPGAADNELLRQWLATADVCVSLDEHSPMNDRSLMVKVLEYMAMGKAIVQFPLQEMRRVCGDSVVYAADGDARDLAEKLRELIDDRDRRDRLGEAARTRLHELGLTWPDQIPILLRAVEQAAALRNGS
jgi:glycosyltransferase involved in cell wall biosynthesis